MPARGDHHGYIGPAVPYYLYETKPIHGTRHLNVGENDSNVAAPFQDANSLVCTRGTDGVEPCLSDDVLGHQSNKDFVLDDKHNGSFAGNRSAHYATMN